MESNDRTIQNWQTGTLYAKREADSSSTTSGRCEQAGMSIYTDILTTTQFKWKPVVWAKVFKGEEHHDLLLMIYSWAPTLSAVICRQEQYVFQRALRLA
ncbi:hypothetical protein KC353_g37 [Hortaea werneckii]|nr:hypothetical protein KC353_g37 [Hortaea werneckii]